MRTSYFLFFFFSGGGGEGGRGVVPEGVQRFPKMLEGARTPVRFLIVLVGRPSP